VPEQQCCPKEYSKARKDVVSPVFTVLQHYVPRWDSEAFTQSGCSRRTAFAQSARADGKPRRGDDMTKLSRFALLACLPLAAAACTSAPETPANDSGVTPPVAAPVETPAPAAGDAVVGRWVDDENDAYSFAADGAISSAGQVSLTGRWAKDGEARYDVDLNTPAGLAKGVACVRGDTMAMRIGDGTVTLLGRTGADGQAATPDNSVTCD
jgi:hypothetical protein